MQTWQIYQNQEPYPKRQASWDGLFYDLCICYNYHSESTISYQIF